MLFIQCLILCILFSIMILPPLYQNPLSQIASYPTAIKKRVYELPQYKDSIASVEQKNGKRKILAVLLLPIFLAVVVYFSGITTFKEAFVHVFILFMVANLYDLIVFDMIIFCHSKKLMIPGTEDMIDEYRNPMHHIVGAIKGSIISLVIALLTAALIFAIGLFYS